MESAPTVAANALPRRRSIWRLFGNLVLGAIDEYSIVLLLFLLVKWLVGERWEIVAFGNSFVQLALLPTLIFFPLAVIRRRRAITLILAPALLYLLVSYAVFFLPRPAAAVPANAQTLSILTYNIHSEVQHLDPIIAVIRDANADIVAVQELSQDAAKRMDQDLANQYPYRKLHGGTDNAVIGQGVLSQYPILDDEYWRNENLSDKLGHQRVLIDVHGTQFAFYNAHPIHPILKGGRLFYTELRTLEIESVLNRASGESGPVIILGDFNMSDQSGDYQRITARYADTYHEVGWGLGFTFPDFSSAYAVPGASRSLPVPPLVRLDYVFHNAAVQALEAKVWGSSGGSDHRPLFVRLAVDSLDTPR